MKKWILSLTLAASVVGLAACGGTSGGNVAKSNAGNVTKDELYDAMKEKIGEQVLHNLVLEKVLSKDYKVTDAEVNERVDLVKEQVGPQFELMLPSYGFKDVEDFRQSLKLNLLQEKAAVKDITVTEDEVKDFYESEEPEREVRHIIVEEEDKIKEVKAKLDEGEDFAELAKEYSLDGTAETGGDLGFISLDDPQMDEQFKEAAFALKKDEISAPIQTEFGWHIIQVTDIKEKEPFDKVKDEYEHNLKVSKLDQQTVQKALKAELEKAKIKVEDKDLEATFDSILNAPEEAPAPDQDDQATDGETTDEK